MLVLSNVKDTVRKLEISDDLVSNIENGVISTGKLNKEQIDELIRMVRSWTKLMQEEIAFIADLKVSKTINDRQKYQINLK